MVKKGEKMKAEVILSFLLGLFIGTVILTLPIVALQEVKIELEYVKKYSECMKITNENK